MARSPRPGYNKQWFADNPGKKRQYDAKRYSKRRAFIDGMKAESCMDCGGSFPPECMDFDHRPGESKLFGVGLDWSRSLDALLAEIAKCDLVCANCHRIRTKSRF